ncbi:MAG: cytochrome b, partial [Methylocella sp.]
MMLVNTAENWGGGAKILHWAAAALIFAMLGLGLTMVHAKMSSGAKFEAYQLHKATGFLVLAVTLARGVWRMASSPPAPPDRMRRWERLLARTLHLALYVLILAMIASGWLMVSGSPLPIPIHLPFGVTVPNLTGPNALLEARAKFTHEVLSKLLIAAIALHVVAALKHHFIDHD